MVFEFYQPVNFGINLLNLVYCENKRFGDIRKIYEMVFVFARRFQSWLALNLTNFYR